MLMNKTRLSRKLIASTGYFAHRQERMCGETLYYIDMARRTQNAPLRNAYYTIADMYHKRYLWYFNKNKNEYRKSNERHQG